MTYKDCDLVVERSEAEGKARFLLYLIARHIGPIVKNGNGNHYYPGYTYIGKKKMAQALGSWPKNINQWLLDLGRQCEHRARGGKHDPCDCRGLELAELYISWGIDPSGQGALYCLTLNGVVGTPGSTDGCVHAGKCLHGVELTNVDEDNEWRWHCPHGHLADESCPHEMNSRKRCICNPINSHGGE